MSKHTSPRTICIVLGAHLSNYYIAPLMRGAVAAGSFWNCRLILYTPLHGMPNQLGVTLNDLPLLPSGADAYFLPAYASPDVVDYCARGGATILIYTGEHGSYPSIGPDNRTGGRIATQHLINHGCRRILHLAGLSESKEAEARMVGYRDALQAAGLPFDPLLVHHADFSLMLSEEIVHALLQAHGDFDGIFAANDMMAMGAINALKRAGLRVPDDIPVIGFDDSVISATFDPPLTSVRQSIFQIGWEGVRLLANLQPAESLPPRIELPVQFIVRESCGCRSGDGTQRRSIDILAEQLSLDGALVSPEQAEEWVAPLAHALVDARFNLVEELHGMVAEGVQRGWYVPALRSYLNTLWQQPDILADCLWQATDELAASIERRTRQRQLRRADRVNAINYGIDLLREYSLDQSVDVALRYMITSGPLAALSAQRTGTDTIIAQHVDAPTLATSWQGSLATFPPEHWLQPGEAMLLMPLEAGTPLRSLVGVVEREGQTYFDLDDMLLRSINTYRSITILHQTLRELDAARSVQLSLLPRSAPPSDDYDIAGATRPARQVGGDLYGYYVRPTGALALALGDVAGKGMPAALLMSACATALAGTIPAGLAPSLTLSQIHQVLQPSVGRGQNAAVCLVYLDGPRVRIANAGAVAPLVRSRADVRMIDVGGLPLGTPLSSAMPYREVEEQLQPGDMLILSSDGIVEAMNDAGDLYGFERFEAAIASGPLDSAQAMLAHLFADVTHFVGDTEMHDDMAIVVARYNGTG